MKLFAHLLFGETTSVTGIALLRSATCVCVSVDCNDVPSCEKLYIVNVKDERHVHVVSSRTRTPPIVGYPAALVI